METIKKLIKNDKFLHFICNVIIVVVFGLIFNPAIGLGLAVIASVGKETYDEYRPNGTGWDWNDICADVVGILIGLFIIL